jgi:hypothetical protein
MTEEIPRSIVLVETSQVQRVENDAFSAVKTSRRPKSERASGEERK